MDQNQNSAPAAKPAPAPAASGKKNIGMAVIAYIIFFVPLITGDAQKDPFVKFHVKQGLALALLSIVISLLGHIIPFYIWWNIGWLLNLGVLVLFVIGIINAANGEQKPLPVIGRASAWFKF